MKTRVKSNTILISIAIFLLLLNFIDVDINREARYNQVERFDPKLSSITSLDQLEQFVDDSAASQQINIYSHKYTALLAYVISCRFYHGFSHFTLAENWVASVGEKFIGHGLASKVEPEDILQHEYAACSQQAIVMMAILRRKNISYRKIGFPHHYALEAKINKNWYYFDPNMEPSISLAERLHENWNGNNDKLKKYYTKHGNVNWEFGNGVQAEYGIENEIPARNARVFQLITAFFSRIAWCIPLLLMFVKKRRPVMYAIKPINHFPQATGMQPMFSA